MKPRSIPISKPSLDDEEWQALREPIQSGWLTSGPKVRQFEENFAVLHQAQHGVATTSCTTALHLILAAIGIQPDMEVIVPAFSWVASANVVLYCGATPVLVDIQAETFNLDPASVKRAITAKTKAIIAVHLFGRAADMDTLYDVAGGIPIIEDAACAAGATYKGRPVGTLGLAAAFSFHPRKAITTGEGGMVTTNDPALAERIEQLRNHGASISEEQRHKGAKPYLLPRFNLLGFNYRMTDLQAAVGIVQLSKLNRFIAERAKGAEFYSKRLAALDCLRCPSTEPASHHAWQAYVCWFDERKSRLKRNELMQALHERGISTRPGTHAIHCLEYYQNRFGYSFNDFPVSRDAEALSIALPLHNCMTSDDYEYVVETLKTLLG